MAELGDTAGRRSKRRICGVAQPDEDVIAVRGVDCTAPPLSLTAAPPLRWPIAQQLVTGRIALGPADGCDSSPTIRLRSVAGSEGLVADRTGHSSPGIAGAAFGTDDREFQLRAKRCNGGTGRIYSITYDSTDHNGNTTQRVVTVMAPETLLLSGSCIEQHAARWRLAAIGCRHRVDDAEGGPTC
jgi:hypothetical protein